MVEGFDIDDREQKVEFNPSNPFTSVLDFRLYFVCTKLEIHFLAGVGCLMYLDVSVVVARSTYEELCCLYIVLFPSRGLC